MAQSVFPVEVSSSLNANAITAAAANTMYQGLASFNAGVYTVTCISSTTVNFEFYSGVDTLVLSGVTSSGTVTVNLASNADRVRLWTNTGTNIVITITLTARSLSNNFSGILDTITSSTTYTGTSDSGYAYAILIGAGGGGGGGTNASSTTAGGGAGGGSGALCAKVVQFTFINISRIQLL